jgi:hypothetical protein
VKKKLYRPQSVTFCFLETYKSISARVHVFCWLLEFFPAVISSYLIGNTNCQPKNVIFNSHMFNAPRFNSEKDVSFITLHIDYLVDTLNLFWRDSCTRFAHIFFGTIRKILSSLWSLSFSFQILFSCWIFVFLHLSVVSLPCEKIWDLIPIRGSKVRYFSIGFT